MPGSQKKKLAVPTPVPEVGNFHRISPEQFFKLLKSVKRLFRKVKRLQNLLWFFSGRIFRASANRIIAKFSILGKYPWPPGHLFHFKSAPDCGAFRHCVSFWVQVLHLHPSGLISQLRETCEWQKRLQFNSPISYAGLKAHWNIGLKFVENCGIKQPIGMEHTNRTKDTRGSII